MKQPLLLLSCFLLFVSIEVHSFPLRKIFHHKQWNRGMVAFANGDTIYCQLSFTRKVTEGLLQILDGRRIRVVTVKEVSAFSFYDSDKKRNRKYITLSFLPSLSTREHEVFVEQLYTNNNFLIVNHRTLGYRTGKFRLHPLGKKTVVDNRYLIDNRSGKILPMEKESLLQFVDDERQEILAFIQQKGIKIKSIKDFILVLDYHQSLSAL
jgi:hypothetical protein